MIPRLRIDVRMRSAQRFARLLALVCLLAVVLASTAEAAHLHRLTGRHTNPARCVICAAAHSSPILTSSPAPLPVIDAVLSIVVSAAPDVHTKVLAHDLFVRPPPELL